MDLKPYLDLITSQHRNSPRYMAWVRFLVSLFDVDIGMGLQSLFNVHKARGQQLDILGEWVGTDRGFPPISPIPGYEEGLTDDTYRRLMLAKIVRNQFKGQQGDLQNLWESVFESDILAVFRDNQDMTMDVELIGNYTPIDIELVLHGYIVPKPLGVGMKVNMTTIINAETLGVALPMANTAKIGVLLLYYDPSPAHVDLGYGVVLGSAYGKTEIDFEYTDPAPTTTVARVGEMLGSMSGLTEIEMCYTDPNEANAIAAAGVSPIIISGIIAIANNAYQAFHPSARSSYSGNVSANTASITIPSADVGGGLTM